MINVQVYRTIIFVLWIYVIVVWFLMITLEQYGVPMILQVFIWSVMTQLMYISTIAYDCHIIWYEFMCSGVLFWKYMIYVISNDFIITFMCFHESMNVPWTLCFFLFCRFCSIISTYCVHTIPYDIRMCFL